MLTQNAATGDVLTTAYRLDFRPPDIVLHEGFQGTNNEWMNSIYGAHTVFASKSLRGTSRFFLESVLNKSASGNGITGPLHNKRYLYPASEKCYVYKVDVRGLEYVDVVTDLSVSTIYSSRRSESAIYMLNKGKLDEKFLGKVPNIDSLYMDLMGRLVSYGSCVASRTEEILIRGPITPNKITLYQQL